MGKRVEQTLYKGRFINDQTACEGLLNIINLKGNASQYSNEVLIYTHQNG